MIEYMLYLIILQIVAKPPLQAQIMIYEGRPARLYEVNRSDIPCFRRVHRHHILRKLFSEDDTLIWLLIHDYYFL